MGLNESQPRRQRSSHCRRWPRNKSALKSFVPHLEQLETRAMLSGTPTPGEVVFAFSPSLSSPFDQRQQSFLAQGLASGNEFAAWTSADPTTGSIDVMAKTGQGAGLAIAGNGFASSFVPEFSGRYHVEWKFSSQLQQHFRNTFAFQPAAQLLTRLGDDFVGPDTLLGVNLVAFGFGAETIQELLQGNSSLAHASVNLTAGVRGPHGTLYEDTPASSHLRWWDATTARDLVVAGERFVSTPISLLQGAEYHWQFDLNTEVVVGGWRGRLKAGADNAYRLEGGFQLDEVRVVYDGPVANTLRPDLANSELTLSPGESKVIGLTVQDARNNVVRGADVRYEILSRTQVPGGSGEWVYKRVSSGRLSETSQGYLATLIAPQIGGSYQVAFRAFKPGSLAGRIIEDLVVLPHLDPTLSNPRVDPFWSSDPQERVFSVQYSDPDGDVPVLARAYVNGNVHELALVSGSPFSSTYEFRTTDLAVGRHDYSFAFIDQAGGIAITNGFNGPVIGTRETAFRFSAIVHGGPSSDNYRIDVSQLGVIEGSQLVPPGVTHWLNTDDMVTISAREVRGPGELSGSHRFVVWEAFDRDGHMAGGFPKGFPSFTMTPDLGTFDVIAQWSYQPHFYSLAGRTLDCSQSERPVALSGVTLQLDGFHQSAVRSDTNGNWEFQEVPGGTIYTITPQLPGHVFTPPQISFPNLVQHHSDLTFCARRSDPLAPTTEFVRVPPRIQNESSRATFEWSGRDNVTAADALQYQHQLDDQQPSGWSSATSFSTVLANGVHKFRVRARDAEGNVAAAWTSHDFAISAAPRIVQAALLDHAIHRGALTVAAPVESTQSGDQIVFTADQFGLVGESFLPVKIFRQGEVTPWGALDAVATQLDLPSVVHETDVGFVLSLPATLTPGTAAEFEIQFGQSVHFGWQDEISVPPAGVNTEIPHGQHLDAFNRLWRLGSKQVENSDAFIDDDSYLFVQASREHGTLLDETLLDVQLADFQAVDGKFSGTRWFHLSFERPFVETPTEIWAFWRIEQRTDTEVAQGVLKHGFAFQRFNKITLQPIGAPVSSPLSDTLYTTPVRGEGAGAEVFLLGESTTDGQLVYTRINSSAEIVEQDVVIAAHPADLVLPRFVHVRTPVIAEDGSVWLFYGRSWNTSLTSTSRREQLYFQLLNPNGTVFKGETPLTPPPPSEESTSQSDLREFLSGPLINAGKVWVSFATAGISGVENFYSILNRDGAFFKNSVLTPAPRVFQHADHDAHVWAREQQKTLLLRADGTIAGPAFTATELVPDQAHLSEPASVLVHWNGYRKFNRWDQPTRTLAVTSAPGSAKLEVLDLDQFGQAAHVANLTVRLNQSPIAHVPDEAPQVSEFDISYAHSNGLLDFQQTGLLGGEIIASFIDNVRPFVASFVRQTPLSPWTNDDQLIWRASFSEDVAGVDRADFAVNGSSTTTVTQVKQGVTPDTFEITLSGGDLADFNGLIGVDLAGSHDITDLVGNALRTREPRLDQRYLVDNVAPGLTSFRRQSPPHSPTNVDQLVFRATFDEAVTNVDPTDFAILGATSATVTGVAGTTSAAEYDVTVSGGDLGEFRGVVGLDLAANQDITDRASNPLVGDEPAIDQTFTLSDLDFGDAPTAEQSGFVHSYPTRLRDNGAGHGVSALFLGERVDSEPDGQPDIDAGTGAQGGDDHSGEPDEDGVLFVTSVVATDAVPTVATVAIVASANGFIDGWIDFRRDGDWDETAERIADSWAVTAGLNVLPFNVPAAESRGQTAARFRLSSSGGLAPTGPTADGEVEDYSVQVMDGNSAAGAPATIQLPLAAALDLFADAGDVVARAGDSEWFRAPREALNRLAVSGSDGDDRFNVANIDSLFAGFLSVQAADGRDTLVVTDNGARLDLTQLADTELQAIETIDLQGSNSTLVLNRDEVWNINQAHQLYALLGVNDSIDLASGWQFATEEKTRVEQGEFYAVLDQNEARLLLSGPFDWQNPVNPLDTDTNEVISPRDALVIINELNNRRFHDANGRLVDAATVGPFNFVESFFFDVRSDNHISPVDALRIIDFLNGGGDAGEGESHLTAAPSFGVPGRPSISDEPLGSSNPQRTVELVDLVAGGRLKWHYTLQTHRTWANATLSDEFSDDRCDLLHFFDFHDPLCGPVFLQSK